MCVIEFYVDLQLKIQLLVVHEHPVYT